MKYRRFEAKMLAQIVEPPQMSGLLLQAPDLFDDAVFREHGIPTEMLTWLRKEMESIFGPLARSKSAAEFTTLRSQNLTRFVSLSAATFNLLNAETTKAVIDGRLQGPALHRIEGEISSDRIVFLDESARQKALFYLETFQRAYTLSMRLIRSRPSKDQAGAFLQLAGFALAPLFYSVFHLECIRYLLDHNVQPDSSVLYEILSGFRFAEQSDDAARRAIQLLSGPDDEGEDADREDALVIGQADKDGCFISIEDLKDRVARRRR